MSEYYGEDVLFEAAEEVETAPTVVALQNFQDNCCRFVKIIIYYNYANVETIGGLPSSSLLAWPCLGISSPFCE